MIGARRHAKRLCAAANCFLGQPTSPTLRERRRGLGTSAYRSCLQSQAARNPPESHEKWAASRTVQTVATPTMRRARALLRAAVLLRAGFTYDAEIAAQMDVEEEGLYDEEIRIALENAGYGEYGEIVPEPFYNVEPEPCLQIASLTLRLDTEVVWTFREHFEDDVGDVVDLVDERQLSSGGGCEDSACVSGKILDRVRNVREAMERLERGWWDAPFLLTAAYNDTQLQVNATIDDLFIDGLTAIKAEACFALRDTEDADACIPLTDEYVVAFEAQVTGASPGAHKVYVWLRALGADDRCATLLKRDRTFVEYFVPAATNAYWSSASVQQITSFIGYPVTVAMGRASYGLESVKLLAYGGPEQLHVGNFSSIGPGVSILLGGEHRYGWTTTFPFPAFDPRAASLTNKHAVSKGDVVIGSDVFIGADAKILSGVKIGHGAVIGAGAVVAKNVRPYAIVVGNPAREIKRRFDDVIVDQLLKDAWWTWDDAVIVQNFASLMAAPGAWRY